jgi:hypothetical protein
MIVYFWLGIRWRLRLNQQRADGPRGEGKRGES